MAFQILSSDKVLRINGNPVLGMVQSLDWNPSFNAQDVFELGNTAKVDTSLELQTAGTMELMSTGGMAGVLARMLVHRVTGAFAGSKYDEELLAFSDGGTGTTATADTTGMTPSAYVGKYLLCKSGPASGEWRRITANTATVITVAPVFTSTMASQDVAVVGGKNGFSFVEGDFTECLFDLIVHEKADNTNLNRAVMLPRCYASTISGRAQADGNATESIAFEGDFAMGLTDPFHDVQSADATYTSPATVTCVDTSIGSGTHELIYLYVDEQRLRTVAGDGVYATLGAAGLITVTGLTLSSTSVFRASVFASTASSTFPDVTAIERITGANYIRGNMADIFLAPATLGSELSSERWLRAQSIDWNVNFKVQALKQIAFAASGTPVYARLPTLPFETSVNVSVTEDQWDDWAAMLTADTNIKNITTPGGDVYLGSYDFSPQSLKEAFAVNLKYYDKSKNLLQELRFTDLRIDGFGSRVNVGGRGEISWNLKGTAFNLIGYNVA